MSLDWNLEKIDGYMDLCWPEGDDGEKRLNPVTNALIWTTVSIGMGEITAANAAEFYGRVYAVETVYGAQLRAFPDGDDGPGVERRITFEDVEAHIGLHTNVFPKVPAGRFAKCLLDAMTDQAASVRLRAERVAASTTADSNA